MKAGAAQPVTQVRSSLGSGSSHDPSASESPMTTPSCHLIHTAPHQRLACVKVACHALAFTLALLATPALAQDDIAVDVTYQSYEVGGDDLYEIQAAMNAEGPYGFPAYTTWNVKWTAACEISVTATIVLPDLGPDADLSEEEEATFHIMLENLEEHENNHVEFGIGFARDVQGMGCRGDTASVHQEWLAEERNYDADTEHGRTEGAWLITD